MNNQPSAASEILLYNNHHTVAIPLEYMVIFGMLKFMNMFKIPNSIDSDLSQVDAATREMVRRRQIQAAYDRTLERIHMYNHLEQLDTQYRAHRAEMLQNFLDKHYGNKK